MRWLFALCFCLGTGLVQAFDHTHSTWDSLLQRHLVEISGGKASQFDSAGVLLSLIHI